MKVLITGGAGFIGSHLVEAELRGGTRVVVLDNESSGAISNLRHVWNDIQYERGDVRDSSCLSRIMANVEVVYHLAAIPSVEQSMRDPRPTLSVGIEGTLAVLDAASRAGVRRVVMASSSAVYGNASSTPISEDTFPNPLSPYALSKLTTDHLCAIYSTSFDVETVCLRYFNVYGPRQNPQSEYAAVVPKFVQSMVNGRSPIVFGDGGQTRDFVSVIDVVKANQLAAQAVQANGGSFNIGSGRSTSLLQLISIINHALGTHIDPVFDSPRPGDIRDSVADITRASSVLGFVPSVELLDGIRYVLGDLASRKF